MRITPWMPIALGIFISTGAGAWVAKSGTSNSQPAVIQSPSVSISQPSPLPDAELDIVAFERGYQSGFKAGAASRPEAPINQQPNLERPNSEPPIAQDPEDDLSLFCQGTIQNRVDFRAFFTREWGFYKLELSPRTSDRLLEVSLSYQGENRQNQGVWRGTSGNVQADVSLVHLSTQTVQIGDQISVGYDGQWGRATCEEQPQEPEEELALVCEGTIRNSTDFTALFTREWGFYQIELRPRRSDRLFTVSLDYAGENRQNQGIWRSVAGDTQANVSLVHLSTEPVQVGDQVSVSYDGQWGRATCEEAAS